jgi:hypothetical protein
VGFHDALGSCQTQTPLVFVKSESAGLSMRRINHQEAYSDGEACTNQAESYFSRLRRAEAGHHHHIAGPYLLRYAQGARGGKTRGAPIMARKFAALPNWP